VCHNISCALRGAEEILSEVCRVTGAQPGRVSPDGRYSVERVECQGACTAAPMLVLDGAFHENLAKAEVERVLATPKTDARRARCACQGAWDDRGNALDDAPAPDAAPEARVYLLARVNLADSHKFPCTARTVATPRSRKVLTGGYTPAQVIQIVKDSGLRGRGGAGFLDRAEMELHARSGQGPAPALLAVNADESEPGTCKDRVLMEKDRTGLVEGILIACFAMRVEDGYVYVRGEYRRSYERVEAAIAEAGRRVSSARRSSGPTSPATSGCTRVRAPTSAARRPG